jgi:transcriptional regulator with XRE-family HTH domain
MNNLKELREQLGLQQKEFCEPIGIKQTTYSNYELGITEPSTGSWAMRQKAPGRRSTRTRRSMN